MEISYVNNADDLVAMHEYHARNNPSGKRQRPSRVIMVWLLLLALMLVLGLLWNTDRLTVAMIPLIAMLGLAFLLLVSSTRIQAWLIRRNASKGHSGKILHSPQQITLTHEAVLHRAELGSSSTKWAGIEHVGSTPSHLFIFNSPTSAYVVPRRAFENEEQFKAFTRAAKGYRKNAVEQRGLSACEKRDWGEAAKAFHGATDQGQIQTPQVKAVDGLVKPDK